MARMSAFLRDPARTIALAALLALAAPGAARSQFINDPATEPAGANQSYPSLAEMDGIIVAAFADFRTGSSHRIRCSYSRDSGATWTELGTPPAPGTALWKSDPRVVASPVHGKFFVFGGANDYPVHGAVFAFVPLAFPGGVPTWGTPGLVRVTWPGSAASYVFAHDAVVSRTTGRLFVASLLSDDAGGHSLDLQYSDDEGQSWSAPLPQDSVGGWPVLRLHGNRVYLMNGSGTPAYLAVTVASAPAVWTLSRVPKARDAMSSGYPPGGRTNHFVLDATNGAHDGRLYAVWTEAYDFTDDPMPDPLLEAPPVSEIEPDETFATARPFAVGDVLRGALATTSDEDHFRVHLVTGERVVLWADSVSAGVTSLDLVVSDTLGTRPVYRLYWAQREGRFTYVAPHEDDYDFRLSGTFPGTGPHGYRLRTAHGYAGSEPAIDQSDILTAFTDNDGATWSQPVLAVGSPIGLFDDGPVIEVAADGRPQIGYWARTPTGGVLDARWRLLRSNDAGASWQSGLRLTNTPNTVNWSMLTTANWGLNAMLALPDRVVHAFGEVQPTETVNTDLRARRQIGGLEVFSCGANYAGAAGDLLHFGVMVTNADSFFTEPVRLLASFDRNWPTAEDTVYLPRAATSLATLPYAIPDTAVAGEVHVQLVVAHFNQGLVSCYPSIYVQPGVGVDESPPVAFGLGSVWPNPAAGNARIGFAVPRPAWVTLDVLDVSGRRVARLADRLHEAGEHVVTWDGFGPGGARLPAGVYLLELRSAGRRDVKRLVRLE